MGSSSIELKVLSCKDLKAFHFFQKLWVYALVSIVSDDPDKKLEQSQEQRTPTDKEGDGNPEWNHEMRFDLDESSLEDCDHLFIHFDVRLEVVLFGDKTIGEVRIPFKDLVDESNGIVRFVSYEVRTADGKPNGVLNFSYKVNSNKGNKIGPASPSTKIDGFSTVHHHHHHHHHPSPEVHHPMPEVPNPSSLPIHYPSLELENPSQEIYSAPQQVLHYHPAAVQHTSHETYYPPPLMRPPPPPPLLPPPWQHPPPPPPPHGPFYHPHPPQVYPWAPDPYEFGGGGYRHSHTEQGTGDPAVGRLQASDNGETCPGGARDLYPSLWNGR
ncbi:hypothetical protein L1049_002251 [Liquidambar formosana]|uniref:C2 domain-containing protein n=1 Tax=Liquidambar formosana TaxID=63359 RepID=A0AAP0NGR1_LIQFO